MLLFDEVINFKKKLCEILKKSLFYLKKRCIHGSIELKKYMVVVFQQDTK
nr:hypothetical protein [Buchnera aphidicola]